MFSVEVCLSQPSRLIQTAKGAVEIACLGEGPTVLSVHGGPGGCDQGLLMALPLLQAGFHVIAPSRPGYSGHSPQQRRSPGGAGGSARGAARRPGAP